MKFGGSAQDIEECEAGNWRTDWSSEGRFHNCPLSILMQQQQHQKKKAELSFGRMFEQTDVIGIYSSFSDCFTPLYHLQLLHPIE